jgi:hypothetical protein
LIKKVLSQEDTQDGWVNVGPDFDPRTFGFRKLGDLIRKTNREAECGPISIWIKRRSKK